MCGLASPMYVFDETTFKVLGIDVSKIGGEIIHKMLCPLIMEGAKVWLDKNIDIEDALVVCCFPSVGMVSSVVAHFLIDHLNLKIYTNISRFYMRLTWQIVFKNTTKIQKTNLGKN